MIETLTRARDTLNTVRARRLRPTPMRLTTVGARRHGLTHCPDQSALVAAAHVALAVRPGSAQIQAGSNRALTFGGRPEVVIPAGADYLSDPVDLAAPALSPLAVSLYLPSAPAQQTGHPGSRSTSFLVR